MTSNEIFYHPVNKIFNKAWKLEGNEVYGEGKASHVYKVCKDKDCNYVMKVIHKNSHQHIKREICFQKVCSKYRLTKPVEDWWLLPSEDDKGGIIITPILQETLSERLISLQNIQDHKLRNKEKWKLVKKGLRLILKLHELGIAHYDSHVENMMFDDHDRLFFIDMGCAGFIRDHQSKNPITPYITDYNQFFYNRNNTINLLFKGFVPYLRKKMYYYISKGKSPLEAEKKVITDLLSMRFFEVKNLIRSYSHLPNKVTKKKFCN